MTPRATMRLQFHKDFTFADAERLVPYLVKLGISHVYASPITAARTGSLHGYDVVDPTRVNPELGGELGYRRLVDALRSAGLGVIVDIVLMFVLGRYLLLSLSIVAQLSGGATRPLR